MHSSTLFTAFTTLAALAIPGQGIPAPCSDYALEVKTESGVLHGFVSPSASNVRQFLGIPFAQPPVASLRWQPPAKLNSSASINATDIGPSCPQQLQSTLGMVDVFSADGGNQTEQFPLQTPTSFSEDCLTLNVWTPRKPTEGLPVIVWYFGGGFIQGGANSLYFNPQSWIERTQEHIVVTVNFRSNIFGFPNAAGLTENNLGLLDQRMALEWVRDNIANFGGDPLKIVTWGQSAGAIAVDILNFAYPSDPIASGMILDSGTVLFPEQAIHTYDTAHTNFTTVAAALGCNITESEVDCLRETPFQDILDAVATANLTQKFITVVDDQLVFSDYKQQFSIGALSSIPAIIGSNLNELNALIPYIPGVSNVSISNAGTISKFQCTAATSCQLRDANGLTTYRYRYDGNFTNVASPEFPGAIHTAELPLLFGTAGEFHGASTPYENVVSAAIQDLWVQFAKDPQGGLAQMNWSSYADGKAALLGDIGTPVQEMDISELDSVCPAASA
jgi:acetylcholinesterase